jgi:O-antigen ligase
MSVVATRGLERTLPDSRRKSSGDRLLCLWLFVVGLSSMVDVPIMGRVMGPDILCAVGLLAVMMGRGGTKYDHDAKLFFVMVALWLFGALLTDMIRGTSMDDLVRGWSKIFFFTISFAYLYLATKRKLHLLIWYLLGLNVGALATLLISPDEFFFDYPWKFGYGPPATAFTIVCISTPFFARIVGPWGQVAVTMAAAAVNLAGESRSVFALLLGVAGIVVLGAVFARIFRGRPIPKMFFAVTVLGGLFFYQGVVAIYETAATSGILGPEALEKYENQTQGGMGLLLGGRAESLVSTQAIADSPIIGHGSWAKDYSYVALFIEALEKRGGPLTTEYSSSGLIPSHSFLLGSWVEHGIFGGLFWIYIFVLCLRSLYSLFRIPSAPRPLVTFVILTLMWDVLFSPFAAQQRFIVPVELCFVFWAIRNEQTTAPPRRQGTGEVA